MNIFSLPNEKGYSRFFCTKGIFGGILGIQIWVAEFRIPHSAKEI